MALRRSPMGLCSAVSPFHQNPMLKACLLCGLFALCCWGRDTFPSVPSSEGTLFAFCLLPVMFVCQSGATLGWSWVSCGVFQKGSSKKLQHTFPAFPPETFFLMAGPWNQTHCWFPSHCYICNHSCECGYPLLLCCRSHFRVVLPLLKLFTYSLALASCWVGLGQEHIGGGRSVICVVVGGGRLTS